MSDIIDIAKKGIAAYNEANWDAVRELASPGVQYDEVATHRKLEGIDQVLEAWKGWRAAFSDSKGTINSAIAAGDTAVIEVTWTGTHDAPMPTPNGEIPATGKSINIRACQITKIVDGKMTHQTHYFDMATMMQQLGLVG